MKLRKSEWVVKPCSHWTAVALVEQFHYAKSGSKQSVATHGLYRVGDDKCYGVTWWLPPPSKVASASVHKDWRNVLSLSRLVIHPDAPKNAASFLLSRSVKMLPERYHALVTYADTWQNHTGAIYRATNWEY